MNTAMVEGAEARARRSMNRNEYERFLPLVRRNAMRLARRVPASITVADLVGYGWIGLMEAYRAAPRACRTKSSKPTRCIAFAARCSTISEVWTPPRAISAAPRAA